MKFVLIPLLLLTAGLWLHANAGDAEAESGEPTAAVNMETVKDFIPDLTYAQVVAVKARLEPGTTWRFDVTVRHNDEGWDHYADRWQVVDPESGVVYGERELAHPHDNEQPFTRSQSGIRIPDGVTSVLVRSRCTDHDYSGKAILVDLSAAEGDGYTVIR